MSLLPGRSACRHVFGQIRRLLRAWYYAGWRYACPCCGGQFRTLLPFGEVVQRPNVCCPRCESLERHRLIRLYLEQRTDIQRAHWRVLHIAPEPIFYHWLKRMPNLDYIAGDLDPARADVQLDVMNLRYPDSSFDGILCIHVLEHVPDDRRALRELHRVLKPGGWALILSPIDASREKTDEDPSVIDPRQRQLRFGQHDHVRLYGRDYIERLSEAGFCVRKYAAAEVAGSEELARRYVLKDEIIYASTKPEM